MSKRPPTDSDINEVKEKRIREPSEQDQPQSNPDNDASALNAAPTLAASSLRPPTNASHASDGQHQQCLTSSLPVGLNDNGAEESATLIGHIPNLLAFDGSLEDLLANEPLLSEQQSEHLVSELNQNEYLGYAIAPQSAYSGEHLDQSIFDLPDEILESIPLEPLPGEKQLSPLASQQTCAGSAISAQPACSVQQPNELTLEELDMFEEHALTYDPFFGDHQSCIALLDQLEPTMGNSIAQEHPPSEPVNNQIAIPSDQGTNQNELPGDCTFEMLNDAIESLPIETQEVADALELSILGRDAKLFGWQANIYALHDKLKESVDKQKKVDHELRVVSRTFELTQERFELDKALEREVSADARVALTHNCKFYRQELLAHHSSVDEDVKKVLDEANKVLEDEADVGQAIQIEDPIFTDALDKQQNALKLMQQVLAGINEKFENLLHL